MPEGDASVPRPPAVRRAAARRPPDHPGGQGHARLPAAPRGPALPPQTRRHLGRTCGRPVRQDPGHQAASDLPPHRVPRTRNRGHLLRGAVGGRPCSLRLAPCASAPDRCPTTGWRVVATRTGVGVAWAERGRLGRGLLVVACCHHSTPGASWHVGNFSEAEKRRSACD